MNRASFALMLVLLPLACSGGGGPDSGVGDDAGGARDAIELPDARPPRFAPAFPPRRIFWDPTVVCDPLPPATHVGPDASPPERGTIRWVVTPATNPEYLAASATLGSIALLQAEFTGRSDRGFIAFADPGPLDMAVRGDGSLGGLVAVGRNARPDPLLSEDRLAWVTPFQLVVSALGGGAPVVARVDELPVVVPGDAALTSNIVVAADGTLVWASTDRTFAAVCPIDGRFRWVVEYDPPPTYVRFGQVDDVGAYRNLYVDGNGVIAVVGTWGYRITLDGNVPAEVELAAELPGDLFPNAIPVGLDATCGLGMWLKNRFEWRDPESFELRRAFGLQGELAAPIPLEDCGVLDVGSGDSAGRLRRLRPDGASEWTHRVRPAGTLAWRPAYPIVPLADGSFLLVRFTGTDESLEFMVFDAGGEEVWSRTHTGECCGITSPAFYMSPEGVFYYGISPDPITPAAQRLVAIEIGVPARLPYMWPHAGQDWTRRGR